MAKWNMLLPKTKIFWLKTKWKITLQCLRCLLFPLSLMAWSLYRSYISHDALFVSLGKRMQIFIKGTLPYRIIEEQAQSESLDFKDWWWAENISTALFVGHTGTILNWNMLGLDWNILNLGFFQPKTEHFLFVFLMKYFIFLSFLVKKPQPLSFCIYDALPTLVTPPHTTQISFTDTRGY